MTINGQEITMPSRAAVAEHLVTIPMALTTIAAVCGIIAMAGFWAVNSPWFKLLMGFSVGLPPLAVQLAQMWHSRNVRDKIAVANGSLDAHAVVETELAPEVKQ